MLDRTAELAFAGRVVLWAMRHDVHARDRSRALPSSVPRLLQLLDRDARLEHALETFFVTVLDGARRPLALAPPGAPNIGRDERDLLLALVAAYEHFVPESRALLAEHQHGAFLQASTVATWRLADALAFRDLPLIPAPTARSAILTFTNGSPLRDRAMRGVILRTRGAQHYH